MFLALAAASSAAAQVPSATGFAVDRFEPAGAGSEWFTLESLDFRGHLRPGAGLLGDWAHKPLVIFDQDGNEVAPLVREQAMAHADVGLVLWGRVRLDLNLPVAILQRGTEGVVNGTSYAPPPRGPGLGDVRLGLDVRLFGQAHDRITAAAGVLVFAPTGNVGAFTSDGQARFWPHLSLAGDVGPVAWAARLGYHVRPRGGLAPGDEVTAALAAGWRVSPAVLVGPEVYASSARTALGKPVATPLEVLVGAHLAIARDWMVGAGVAPGLTDGPGSPAVRFVAGLEYWPAMPEPPRPIAASPPAPRPVAPAPKPPAPPPPAVKPPEPETPPEPPPPPPPADTDGDDIVDPEDACPDAAGPHNDDPARNGCPVVRIERGQIRIREQVQFKTASATILKQSDYILQAVVKILVEHSEIRRVRVEGHTDVHGKPAYNKKLSQRRAASVVKWLVKHGIKKRRLTSAGFGQERPIATNETEEGRRQNRRVEFHIVDGPGAEP